MGDMRFSSCRCLLAEAGCVRCLAMCRGEDKEPEKEQKGSVNVRISPRLHKKAFICSATHQMTLNSFVESAIRQATVSAN